MAPTMAASELRSLFVYFVCLYVFRATVLWSRAKFLWSHSVERNFSTSVSPLLGFFHHLSSIRASLSFWQAELRDYTGYCAEAPEVETCWRAGKTPQKRTSHTTAFNPSGKCPLSKQTSAKNSPNTDSILSVPPETKTHWTIVTQL
ncbi:hypothetical protein ATANTOWER_014427 [Ataeniobius toweri]|uniref:Secreted protein n=1 Tax=Ataeniobius toweri TaxID=208326 RepID=A0ABU7AYM1_9TELE|nr:hypothetical protein [Ataeniobius toweri]